MLGAIIGDIVGSTYEFNNTSDYDFELFPAKSSFTDDTVCTIAVADAILRDRPYRDCLHEWGRRYPHPIGAYGNMFARWLASDDPQPMGSYGNGSAMRVSPVGWAFATEAEVLRQAQQSAECSHSHPEGIKGAQATAQAVWYLARHHDEWAKEAVRALCATFYGPDYADHLPQPGEWDGTCQGCVPLSMHLFLLSTSFEDALRRTISYGGDSDTLGAIVGAMAGAFYGIPSDLAQRALSLLPPDMQQVVRQFEQRFPITIDS